MYKHTKTYPLTKAIKCEVITKYHSNGVQTLRNNDAHQLKVLTLQTSTDTLISEWFLFPVYSSEQYRESYA